MNKKELGKNTGELQKLIARVQDAKQYLDRTYAAKQQASDAYNAHEGALRALGRWVVDHYNEAPSEGMEKPLPVQDPNIGITKISAMLHRPHVAYKDTFVPEPYTLGVVALTFADGETIYLAAEAEKVRQILSHVSANNLEELAAPDAKLVPEPV